MATTKRTALQIANDALDEQRPIDTRWLCKVYYSCKSEKERREWAKGCLEITTDGTESKQLIARAATEFLELVNAEVR